MIKRILICCAMFLLLGCSGDADELGIIARVNGVPIQLSQLEFQHDQFQADTAGAFVPSVEKLRQEYGEILTDLIVQELVVQELARRDLPVTDRELLKAEETVRADYPEGAFDQMLVEEYIDLKAWRKQLKAHLAMKKFYQQVLRPQIKIDYKEAEQYYREHISDFYLPESLRILVVRGPSREIVGKAVEKFLAERDSVNLETAFGEVETREVVVREGKLSATWKNAMNGLKPGQASGVLTDRFGFEALVLLERSPAKMLPPAQAYPIVEKALLENKMRDAFGAWLKKAVAAADIQVSSHLLPERDGMEEEEAPAIPGDDLPGEPEGNGSDG
ncbi:peptidyl-prolyl cis-trans isomerase [Pseudodesulfovibrio cashew]|uniref:peptidylprolyl isomerase n=1 Tax=Pseudodesulfovibrio cashew TaxID=2678688 RepID=A0A6I6JGF2_9BACT|nr:peptidylprolyl isomerase [Pseudodesulfovibrio cashew]QGY41251.1 peptidyl-prolyl cis-trans isomerase [Pseudodesulfovibrio cashew]